MVKIAFLRVMHYVDSVSLWANVFPCWGVLAGMGHKGGRGGGSYLDLIRDMLI